MRILLAESEQDMAQSLKALLEQHKYAVDVVFNGTDALDYAMTGNYDGLILEHSPLTMDSISTLQNLRNSGIQTPAMLFTGKNDPEERISGYNAGADDYLPQPFSSSEFLARVKALLRRSGVYLPDILTFGNLSLDTGSYELCSDFQRLRLSNKEFQIMELFLRNPKGIFSTGQLMDRIWGWDNNAEINVVWTNITYLRRKLTRLKANVEIRSIRGVGYVLDERLPAEATADRRRAPGPDK